jgi:hypothetical protein
MKLKHNKKRNVGLLFEQLSYLFSESLLKEDRATAEKCTKILKKHFQKGTALHQEMRLFRSLSEVKIKNDSLIVRILAEGKKAARNMNKMQLSKEKTQLVILINELLGKNFFEIKNPRYRTLATIQILLNEWRNNSNQIVTAQLEDVLITEMKSLSSSSVSNQQQHRLDEINNTSNLSEINSLVIDIAKKKFFQKHKSLDVEQIRSLFEMMGRDTGENRAIAKNLSQRSIQALNNYFNTNCNDKSQYFVNTLREAREKIQQSDFSTLDSDQCISRSLAMYKLIKELNHEQ